MSGEGPAGAQPRLFPYHRSIAPMMWVFVALASIELLVVHFLIAFWSGTAALILSALTLASIVWIVLVIRSMRRLPVMLDDRHLVMRVGTLRSVEIPLDRIGGLRSDFDDAALRQKEVVNLALIAWPNVFVELSQPIEQRGREIRGVAHKLDDPHAFTAAIRPLLDRSRAAAMEPHDRKR